MAIQPGTRPIPVPLPRRWGIRQTDVVALLVGNGLFIGDHNGAEEHAAPAADGEPNSNPEISEMTAATPSAHSENAGVTPQLALIEIVLAGNLIGNPAFVLLLRHRAISSMNRHPVPRARFTPRRIEKGYLSPVTARGWQDNQAI